MLIFRHAVNGKSVKKCLKLLQQEPDLVYDRPADDMFLQASAEVISWKNLMLLEKALPSRSAIEKVWSELTTQPLLEQCKTLRDLRGFGGLNYSRKNFLLFCHDARKRSEML